MIEDLPTLKNPTVGELLEALSHLPQGIPAIIRDADTGGKIDTIHMEIYKDRLVLYGDYAQMSAE